MRTYKASDVLQVTGISRTLYNQWVFKGVISPYKEADGPGRQAKFSFGNLVSMKLVLKLRDMGMRLKPSAQIGRIVQGIMDNESEQEKYILVINSENPSEYTVLELKDTVNFFKESVWTITQFIRLDHLNDEVNRLLEQK